MDHAHPITRDLDALAARIQSARQPFSALVEQMHQVVVGQEELVEGLLLGILANGHVLIEGVPGLAKTTAVAAMAAGLHASFRRIQFTPDLLPADIVGTQVYEPKAGTFTVRQGPIFTNIVLADEVNRAPAKVQSALLEAMQERQVSIGGETFALPRPFMVLATQNPIEQEGTYQLPEAQVDRFLLKCVVGYPTPRQERAILDRMARTTVASPVESVMHTADIESARTLVDAIHLDDRIKDYIVNIVVATRDPASAKVPIGGLLQYGASPRATIALTLVAKAKAFLDGRAYCTPQDVKDVAHRVLRHRMGLSYEAEAEGRTQDDVVSAILSHVPVP